jgi:hypothetical protein
MLKADGVQSSIPIRMGCFRGNQLPVAADTSLRGSMAHMRFTIFAVDLDAAFPKSQVLKEVFCDSEMEDHPGYVLKIWIDSGRVLKLTFRCVMQMPHHSEQHGGSKVTGVTIRLTWLLIALG